MYYMKKVPKDTYQIELCICLCGRHWCCEKELYILSNFYESLSKKNYLIEKMKKRHAQSKSICISVVE